MPNFDLLIYTGLVIAAAIWYMALEPHIDKTANGWILWYTNIRGKRKFIKLKK